MGDVELTSADQILNPATTHYQSTMKPLQIVHVDLHTNEVRVNRANLEKIAQNLRDAKAEKISVVSVMGAYRTGKSFLLDLFLRFLEYEQAELAKSGRAFSSVVSEGGGAGDAATMGPPADDRSVPDVEFPVPEWMKAAGKLSEASDGTTPRPGEGGAAAASASKQSPRGFSWRGGASRCTEGMWVWPQPFLKTVTITENVSSNEDEEVFVKRKVRVGLLIMDTQGAFDSQTTKQQSATIFGLTTALSSKQLYNIQGRIGADTVEHMHYFSEMAVAASRQGQVSGGPGKLKKKPFQYLELVVRDWPCFDDETFEDDSLCKAYDVRKRPVGNERWSVDLCEKQMQWHLDQHFGPDVKEREAIDTLYELFEEIKPWLYPSPGLKVSESKKRRWDGDLKEIDEDFVRFVDLHCRRTFSDVRCQKVFGTDLSPDTFADVVETLVGAFQGMEVSQMSMVEAIGKAKNLASKDEAAKLYKKTMDKSMSAVTARSGKEQDELQKDHANAYKKSLEFYDQSATFGAVEEIAGSKEALIKDLDALWVAFQEENARRMEKALTAFAGIVCVAVASLVLDKMSDYTCDWWSDTCVQVSKMLVLFYTAVLGVMIWQVYKLLQTRGQAAVGIAVIELAKQCVVLAHGCSDKVVYYVKNTDIEKGKKDLIGLWDHIQSNYVAPFMTDHPADSGTSAASPKKGGGPQRQLSPTAKKKD